MDFQLICRLCLERHDLLLPIFEINLTDAEDPIAISRLLQKYFELPVFEDDGHPHQICAECLHQLRCFYEFKLKCHQAAAKLQQMAPLKTPGIMLSNNCTLTLGSQGLGIQPNLSSSTTANSSLVNSAPDINSTNSSAPNENITTGSTENSTTAPPVHPSASLQHLSIDKNKVPMSLHGFPVIRLSSLLKVVNYFKNIGEINPEIPKNLYKVALGEKGAKRKKRKIESYIDLCDDESESAPPKTQDHPAKIIVDPDSVEQFLKELGVRPHYDHSYASSPAEKALVSKTQTPSDTTGPSVQSNQKAGFIPKIIQKSQNICGIQRPAVMQVISQRVAPAPSQYNIIPQQPRVYNIQRPSYPAPTVYAMHPYITPNQIAGSVAASQNVCGIQGSFGTIPAIHTVNQFVTNVRNAFPTAPTQNIQTANQQGGGILQRPPNVGPKPPVVNKTVGIQHAITTAAQKNAKALEQLTVLIVQKPPNTVPRGDSTSQSVPSDENPGSPTANQSDSYRDDTNQNDSSLDNVNEEAGSTTVDAFTETLEDSTEFCTLEDTREKNALKCPAKDCDRLFCKSVDFVRHLVAEHTKDNDCLICHSKALRNKQRHCRNHLPLKHFCVECGKGFRLKLYLTNHSAEALETPLQCEKCEDEFCVKQDYEQHMKKHEIMSHGSYVVRMCCAQEFLTKEEYNHHRFDCHYVLDKACSVCPERFRNLNELIQHMSKAHPDVEEANYQCPSCPLKFNLKYVKDHKCEPVDEIIRRRCDICFVIFSNVKKMQLHRKSHFSGMVSCKLCDRTFNNKNKYSAHLTYYHSNIRRYRCEVCQKSFKYQGNLQTHRNTKIHQENVRAQAENSENGGAESASTEFLSKETIAHEELENELEN